MSKKTTPQETCEKQCDNVVTEAVDCVSSDTQCCSKTKDNCKGSLKVGPTLGYLKGDGTTFTLQYVPIPSTDLPADVAYTDVANTFTETQTVDANLNVNNTDSATTAVVVKAAASQSVNVLEVKDDTGTVLFSVDPTGNVVALNRLDAPNVAMLSDDNAFVGTSNFTASAVGNRPVQIRALNGQTGDLLRFRSWSGPSIGAFKFDASWQPPQIADTSATNNSFYYSTTSNKLVFKDPSGTVHTFY